MKILITLLNNKKLILLHFMMINIIYLVKIYNNVIYKKIIIKKN
jgi:hypothetical protein